MATEFSREFFADNRIVKASLRCAHKLREKDLDRIKSEIKKLYDPLAHRLQPSVLQEV